MNGDQLPLPVAMRSDELIRKDFEVLSVRALEMQAEQEAALPSKVPMGEPAPVTVLHETDESSRQRRAPGVPGGAIRFVK